MWFRRKQKIDPAEAASGLREQALTLDPSQLGLAPTAARAHVWGVLMETAYPTAVVTLVVLADGTTSLYFSNGGGVLGAGTHSAVHAAGEVFLSAAERQLAEFGTTVKTPPPGVGRVQFYLRTFNGTMSAEGSEDDLRARKHSLSPLFYAGHAVIAAVRESTPPQEE